MSEAERIALYRNRAEQLRSLADSSLHGHERLTLRAIATTYDRLADGTLKATGFPTAARAAPWMAEGGDP